MADGTHIEWTDATWQPITGCSVVSPGCTNCYAMKLAGARLQHHPSRAGLTRDTKAGPVWTGEVRFNEQWLDQPLRWKRGRRIFVCAHGDLFAEGVPDEWIDRVFAVMALAPQHKFQVLTKRAQRMRDYLEAFSDDHWLPPRLMQLANFIPAPMALDEPPEWPLDNVWLGVSVEDQARADERIPPLLVTPAAKRFISAEPLLGPIDLTNLDHLGTLRRDHIHGISAISPYNRTLRGVLDWVIVGGESGPHARPMHPDWARSLRDQCQAAGVAYFFKQWGEWAPGHIVERSFKETLVHEAMERVGKRAAGRLLDGRTWDEMPT